MPRGRIIKGATTLQERLRSPVDYTEEVRLATPGLNWRVPLSGLRFAKFQAKLDTPIIYDTFDYADGTNLDGKLCESGNSTWTIGAFGPATIEGTYLTNTGSYPRNLYAFLPNTPVAGGSGTQPIKKIGGTFRFAGAQNVTTQSATLIVASQDLGWLLHFNFGPSGGALAKRLNGGGFTVLAGYSWPPLQIDGVTDYQVSMSVDPVEGTIQVLTPDGVLQPTITDPDIITISANAQNGAWQIANTDATSAQVQWGLVWLGGPAQSNKYRAAGVGASERDLSVLQGTQGSTRIPYPTIDIPNAGGGGGAGWYRIATSESFGGFTLGGTFLISAQSVGVGAQFFSIDVSGNSTGTVNEFQVRQPTTEKGNRAVVDQVRLTTDGLNFGLDIHINSSLTNFASILDILGIGTFAPVFSPVIGATSLGSDASIEITSSGSFRVKLSFDMTLYVNNSTGNDSNPGTQSQPFATPTAAWNAACSFDLNSHNVFIQFADSATPYAPIATGVPNPGPNQTNAFPIGAGYIVFRGNASDHSQVTWGSGSGFYVLYIYSPIQAFIVIESMTLSDEGNDGTYFLQAGNQAQIVAKNIDIIMDGTSDSVPFYAYLGGSIQVGGAIISRGDMDYFAYADTQSIISFDPFNNTIGPDAGSNLMTLDVGTPNLNQAFLGTRQGQITWKLSSPFVGTATGARTQIQGMGVIIDNTFTGYTAIPGTTNGTGGTFGLGNGVFAF